jgi:hypothetical protein
MGNFGRDEINKHITAFLRGLKMPFHLRTLAILLLFFAQLNVFAQLGGKTVFNSLNIYGSARIAAMGGVYLAPKDGDINLMACNASLMDSSMSGKLALSYVDYYAHTNMGYVAYAHSLRNKRYTLGGTLQYINYGKMERLDPLGNDIGEYTAGDYNLMLCAAYQMDSLWSLGTTLKTVYSSLDTYYSLANALDFSATYHKKSRKFTAAFVLRNVGIQWRTYVKGTRDKLPVELMVGFTKQPRHAPFRFAAMFTNLQKWDLTYDNPNAVVVTDPTTGETIVQEAKFQFGDKLMRHVVLGTEVVISDNFQLRVGYNYQRRQELKLVNRPAMAGFSLGLGFKVKRFNLSYGRAIYHAAGPANHITVATDLNMWY